MRKAREAAGVGSAEMAAELGVEPGSISRWERRGFKPRRQTLLAYALRCGVPIEWLEHGVERDPELVGAGSEHLPTGRTTPKLAFLPVRPALKFAA